MASVCLALCRKSHMLPCGGESGEELFLRGCKTGNKAITKFIGVLLHWVRTYVLLCVVDMSLWESASALILAPTSHCCPFLSLPELPQTEHQFWQHWHAGSLQGRERLCHKPVSERKNQRGQLYWMITSSESSPPLLKTTSKWIMMWNYCSPNWALLQTFAIFCSF